MPAPVQSAPFVIPAMAGMLPFQAGKLIDA